MLSQLVEDNASRNSSVARASLSSDEKQTSNFGSAEIPEMRSEKSQDHDSSSRRRRHTLLSYDEIPSWYQDNPHIRRGYRPVSHSASACFDSLSYAHNETMNIFTHLIPAIGLLVCGLVYVSVRLRKHSGGDAGIVAALMLSEVACLGLSSMYHTLMCHSRAMESLWLRLDFVGIILLIFGSFVSSIYVGFWCEAFERTIYWSMSGSLAAISIVIVLAPAFQGPRWRTLRLLTFVCTGLSGLAPIIHEIYMFGFDQTMKQSGLPYYFAEGGLFLAGAVVYGTRFPESISPGKFDIYGSSHQIFHILVVMATVCHLAGVFEAIEYNYYNRQCSPR
ncbi:mPR-like GPCR protein [Hypoxylon rubiginosum]|uniref:MPR-like GPCR protein n=1 Tax=Hypoxylon rubiginosum TaxID=110542 RepID=A0ACC0CQI4_9PEZI|nr:mPR-like GPCR protein [Hypoxylon rubiginosum]